MKPTFGSLFFLCPWQAPLHRQRSVRLGRNRWTWPLSRWGMNPLRFHITREKFYGVRCNQVESKIRAGNLVRSASWNLWLHVGKRGGIVRESSKGGTHCSTLQIFERVSEERLVFQSKGGHSSPPDTGHMNHPPALSGCHSSAHTLQASLQEVMAVSAGRWAENDNLHFVLHGSEQPTVFLPLWSCWVAKEEQTRQLSCWL